MLGKSVIEITLPSPVLNIPYFQYAFGGKSGREIPMSASGDTLYHEFVSFPGELFYVEEIFPQHNHSIYCVSSPLHERAPLYIDSRFTKPSSATNIEQIEPQLTSCAPLVNLMRELIGTPFLSGGTCRSGILELLFFYPPKGSIDEKTKSLWTLQGLDSAGLLYEATEGKCKRHLSQLLSFGTALPISGKSCKQILSMLQPLDMVIWPEHAWFVLDQNTSIESKKGVGVIQSPLLARLQKTSQKRVGVECLEGQTEKDKTFLIRRFLQS